MPKLPIGSHTFWPNPRPTHQAETVVRPSVQTNAPVMQTGKTTAASGAIEQSRPTKFATQTRTSTLGGVKYSPTVGHFDRLHAKALELVRSDAFENAPPQIPPPHTAFALLDRSQFFANTARTLIGKLRDAGVLLDQHCLYEGYADKIGRAHV